ncbi:MAG: TetR/AcrR family transcriptional regulator [Bacteroidetes bacterium]|nr:TetR/AcrR family transcriptional regulator [Bacteroidota bacterium]
MVKTKKIIVKDISAEEKIKTAAKKIFTRKGFAATRTRDIAEEAGINLALLNYYFRSKQKLFDIIMLENFRQFIHGISVEVFDEKATLEQKLEKVIAAYIDFLSVNPDLPLFILTEIRGNPASISRIIEEEAAPIRSHFFKQLQQGGKASGLPPMEPLHFVANLVGLTVFPFISRPILQRVTNVSDAKFKQLMQERKKLVPVWLKAIMTAKPN